MKDWLASLAFATPCGSFLTPHTHPGERYRVSDHHRSSSVEFISIRASRWVVPEMESSVQAMQLFQCDSVSCK